MNDDDLQSTLERVLELIGAEKWWLLAAMTVGTLVRLTKPDVTWWILRRCNFSPRMRAVAVAVLGIIVSICDMLGSGSTLDASLKWGMSAAIAAMVTHTFAIEVLRDGREIGEPKAGPGRFSRRPSTRPPPGGDGMGLEVDLTGVDSNRLPSSFPKPGKLPPTSFRCVARLAVLALLVPGCGAAATRAATTASGETCEARGKAIIAGAGTCREAVRRLDELVRTDPTCRPFFRGSAEQSCPPDVAGEPRS